MEINGAFPAANMNQDGIGWLLTRVVVSAITLGDVPGLVNHRAAGNGQSRPELPTAGEDASASRRGSPGNRAGSS